MVHKHHSRHVWLIACTLGLGCFRSYGADQDAARVIITDARQGNCIICHFIPIPGVPDNAFGNLGPSLAGVGSRLTPSQIKARIVDPRLLSAETVMPAYGSTAGLYRVQNEYRGRTILTDAQIDALVAYLSSLQ
jgi:L-cysteine S-thiosulfotransferase